MAVETVSKALRHRERRAARRRRRMNVQWRAKDGRIWMTAKFWPRHHREEVPWKYIIFSDAP